MGYYIRVLGTNAEQPSVDFLRRRLKDAKSRSLLKIEAGSEGRWEQLVLSHPNGPEIAVVEYNPVVNGELGQEELTEFIMEVEEYQPVSAASWLKEYLPRVKSIYALQLLSGTDVDDGWADVHSLQGAIWENSSGILQSDGEGFTNEEGYHILWQFSAAAAGKWNMAVLKENEWIAFEMDLGDLDQRNAFLQGHVHPSVRLL